MELDGFTLGEEWLKKCSCGSVHFIRVIPVHGRWTQILTLQEDGTIKTEGCGDSVRNHKQPKTVYCDACGKRHPNPDATP